MSCDSSPLVLHMATRSPLAQHDAHMTFGDAVVEAPDMANVTTAERTDTKRRDRVFDMAIHANRAPAVQGMRSGLR